MFGHPSAYITTFIVYIKHVYKVLEGKPSRPHSYIIYDIYIYHAENVYKSVFHVDSLDKTTAHMKDNMNMRFIGPLLNIIRLAVHICRGSCIKGKC